MTKRMSEGVTEIFKRGGETLSRHKKTAIGGLGGASIATIITVAWPFIHSIQRDISNNTKEIEDLRVRISVVEVKEEMMQKEIDNQQKK